MKIISIILSALLISAQVGESAVLVGFGQGATEPNLIFHWSGMGTGAETLLVTSEATTITNDGGTFDAGGVTFDATGEQVDLTATAGNNYRKPAGTISLYFRQSATASPSYACLFSLYGTGGIRFERYSTSTDRYQLTACGTNWTSSTGGPNIWDQNFHKIEMSWNDANNTIKFRIDGGTIYSGSSLTLDCSTMTPSLLTVGNTRAIGTVAPNGTIKDVKIYSVDNF